MTKNTRRFPRITAFIPVRIHLKDGELIKGEAEDISEGGAYLRCTHPLQSGDIVSVEFILSGMKSGGGVIVEVDHVSEGAPLRVKEKAEVRWTKGGVGYGIQFVHLNPESKKLIGKLVAYCHKMKDAL